MDMTSNECLAYIVNEIHSTVFATVDKHGNPVTCAIDIMDYNENGLYFLTAKGKSFYDRLKNHSHIAFTGMKGQDTLSSIAVSVQGKVKEIGSDRLTSLFEKNPYMSAIYPTIESRNALTVFQIYEGTGEWFDLSKKPIERFSFSIGNCEENIHGYFTNEQCINCKLCYSKCPQKCIDYSTTPVQIIQNNCLHCGNCYEVCPVRAIEKR